MTEPLPPAAREHLDRGKALQGARRWREALQEMQGALAEAPDHPELMEAIAILAGDAGDMEAAEHVLRQLVEKHGLPHHKYRLALVLNKLKHYDEAIVLLEDVLPQLEPNVVLNDEYAYALERTGRPAKALAVLETFLEQHPGTNAAIRVLGALQRQKRVDLVLKRIDEFLVRWPDEPSILDTAAMLAIAAGQPLRGVELLSRRLARDRVSGRAALPGVVDWDGQPFDGTLLIPMEPFIGEEIQLSFLMGEVARRGQRALVEVDARTVPLYRRTWPALEFVARGQNLLMKRAAAGDCRRAETIDLLRLFAWQFPLPGNAGWLKADETLVQRKRAEYQARFHGKRLVGISWRSVRFVRGHDLKSVPLVDLKRTLALASDIAFISLQYGNTSAEQAAVERRAMISPWNDPEINAYTNIDGLAAQIQALDHVVSVSNTTAHLAGALGAPTELLIPGGNPVVLHWGFSGEQTPWYGSMRILRIENDPKHEALDMRLAARLLASTRARC